MTNPIPEDFFTLSLPLRSGIQNNTVIIPDNQRRTGDNATYLALPAGVHTIQMLYRGTATPVHVRISDGSPNGRNIAVLPGGTDAKTVTAQVVVPPGGGTAHFVQQLAVTAEQAALPANTLGLTFILGPTRAQEA